MDDLLTTRQLQALLHVDRITIYRMLADGRLAGFKVGGQWRFSRRDIESWLRQQQEALPLVDEAAADNGGESEPAPSSELPLTCLHSIQSIYADALDVAAITIDAAGAPLTPISNSCRLCSLVLATEHGRRRCAAAWLAAGRAGPGEPQFQTCHAGLLVAAAPVHVGGQRVASVVSCQFVTEGAETGPSSWLAGLPRLAADLGLPPDDLEAASASIHVVPGALLPRIAALVAKTASAFSKIGQERRDLVGRLRRIAEITNL